MGRERGRNYKKLEINMAKKQKTVDDVFSAVDKLYEKYLKTDNIYIPPEKLEDIDTTIERLNSPLLSFDRDRKSVV